MAIYIAVNYVAFQLGTKPAEFYWKHPESFSKRLTVEKAAKYISSLGSYDACNSALNNQKCHYNREQCITNDKQNSYKYHFFIFLMFCFKRKILL